MARTVQDEKLGTPEARLKLAARGKPYWRSLDEGLHLGYRKGKDSGKWVVRLYLGSGEYKAETLDGVADDKGGADGVAVLNFSQAQREAQKRLTEHAERQKAAAAPPDEKPFTVADAIDEHLAYLRSKKKTGVDAGYRAAALILPPLGAIPCSDLTKDTLTAWLNRMVETAPRLRTRPGQAQKYRVIDDSDEARRCRRASANRVLTILKAALNQPAAPSGTPSSTKSTKAWRTGNATATPTTLPIAQPGRSSSNT